MKTPKMVAVGAALAATASMVQAPVAAAGMVLGNYENHTPRDPGHSWVWSVRECSQPVTITNTDCVHVAAIPRPNGQAAPWNADAHLVNGRYTMVVDVPDGVRCVVSFLPSRDTYSWDMVTLQGSVDSVFDAGCGGAPGGTVSYPFTLVHF